MAQVSLTALVDALDASCRGALESAAAACAARGGYEITVEDFMETLLDTSALQDVLRQFERNPDTMRDCIVQNRPDQGKNSGRPTFSTLLYQFLQEAYLLASLELGQDEVTAGTLVLALLQNPIRYGVFPFYKEIKDISAEKLRNLVEGLEEEQRPHKGSGTSGADGDALQKYTIDFTENARAGKTDPVFARGPEIRLMVDILTRRRKNNPILVGDPGVGKTAVVEGLALKIVEGNVPEVLQGVRILGLDMGSLQAGASVKGEFEKRLKAVIDGVKSSPVPTILFIDEAHTLVGSGNAAGSGDGANLLKPALARGEMRTIAATTWSEYKKYFEKDAALARRFQMVKLDEPSQKDTVTILRGIVPYYEETHGVYVRDDAVIRTAELAGRYITGRQLPDKAIDVLDTACARVKVSLGAKPASLEALEELAASTKRELEAVERDHSRSIEIADANESAARHSELQALYIQTQDQMNAIQKQWQKEKDLITAIIAQRTGENTADDTPESGESPAPNLQDLMASLEEIQQGHPLIYHEVSPALVTSIVAEWTGIPAGKLAGSGEAKLAELGNKLRQRIRGQDSALDAIEKAVLSSHAGLDAPTRPNGIFLLVGPSGVGKTETVLAVAEELFGGERMLVSINMSEFQEKHTVSRLIGSPPGYVGYGEGGRLTEAVRRQPYSAVLFDEVEKAHPDVLNLFYQMFDKGILADGEGREVDFRNTMIFMTSNLGSDIVAAVFEEEEAPSQELIMEAIRPALVNFFRPALLGRMTIVPYNVISPVILKELAGMKLSFIRERVRHRHHRDLQWSQAVVDNIAASCTAVDTGARNIDHIISASLLPLIATQLLGSLKEQDGVQSALNIDIHSESGQFICTC